MKNSKENLERILKTSQLGQVEIRSLLDGVLGSGLKEILKGQLRELDRIEAEAHGIACQRGWELRELEPAAKFLTDRRTRLLLNYRDPDSRIADRMILDNTRMMIRALREHNRFPGTDAQIRLLSQRLLDCQRSHIRQLQIFL